MRRAACPLGAEYVDLVSDDGLEEGGLGGRGGRGADVLEPEPIEGVGRYGDGEGYAGPVCEGLKAGMGFSV